ncbi:hypothetical protein BDFB_013214 [Asbolus verrucosus]|uniref:Uncharacterized protein n=1 Tax=Asbolus verrucosus TaxID=1661398 RepID=A0A482V9A3_ASBVE|nr:hypothetical protein BDFB_013214 [Asbolus verrucosus]
MMREHHSLMSLLKKDVPSLYVFKSDACHKLPRHIEDLTRNIYNYFNSSSKRTVEFAEFQTFCNVKMHKILHPSQTRWLSFQAVDTRILEQYESLQLFFIDCVSKHDILACDNILQKLNDPVTKLFLYFLDFVLPFFNNLNKEMQAESPKLHV